MRLWSAQAALDLYLTQVRKLEHLHTMHTFYQRLVLNLPGARVAREEVAKASSEVESPFILTEPQLLAHLARRGARTDRLDHPLLFARSGVLTHGIEPQGLQTRCYDAGYEEWDVNETPDDSRGELCDPADLFSPDEGYCFETVDRPYVPGGPTDLARALDGTLSTVATLGSLLALARSMLSFTPALVSLSLSSFLERAVCGTRPPTALKSLRFLNLGPAPPNWNLYPRLSGTSLEKVERLRLCGNVTMFGREKGCAESIAGASGALPALRKARYTLATHDG